MPEMTEAEAVERITTEAAEPTALDPALIYGTKNSEGLLQITALEGYCDRPRRKAGTINVHDAPALIAYLTKHALPETEVWADLAKQHLVAVINAHHNAGVEDNAGWGDHRAILVLRKTPDWEAWTVLDRKLVSQVAFAEHVEALLPTFTNPTAADMLELAQSFKAHTKVGFESSRRLKSGETTLEYREETTATAGKKGDIAIPDIFELGIAPFDGCPGYKVRARLRYRITDGTLALGYILERPEDILRAAFSDIVTDVDGGITASIWHGTP